ncbi:MAG: hypothetical protein EON93_02540 [Burkholderiales bacterium]|nr:MAG: hypothetical protein EON93_02540 [Burkholderiales bacterium]
MIGNQSSKRDLKNVVRELKSVELAKFQFLNLDEVRTAYGDRWPTERMRVLGVAEQFLDKRIGHADVLIRGDDGFVLVSGHTDSWQASVQAHSLAQGLNRFFLGERQEGQISYAVEVRHATVSVDEFSANVGNLKHAERVPPFPTVGAGLDEASPITLRFAPVWDAGRQAITTYNVVPDATMRETRDGVRFQPDMTPPQLHAEIDELVLRSSEAALKSLVQKGGKAFIGVTIHVDTILRIETRARIFSVLNDFDKDLLRYRTLRLMGVRPGYPRLYLEDAVRALSARLPRVMIAVRPEEPSMHSLLNCGATGAGYVWEADIVPKLSGPFWRKLRADAALARERKKQFFVDGHLSREDVEACVACGVSLISSAALWPSEPTPASARQWQLNSGSRNTNGKPERVAMPTP